MRDRYLESLDDLLKLEFFGMKLGLQNIASLLEFLGRPDRRYPTIHIAGTNGKGSVAAMLSAIFQSDGKKVGLYTSPHLVDFRERIRVNGTMISTDAVQEFVERVWPKVKELNATFFEVTTAMALDYFAMQQVDIAIIEAGLGGRLDATNVLERPLATVVTSIGLDHTAQLGETLELIAGEKAGIFKPGVPAVVNCSSELEHVFRARTAEVEAPFSLVKEFEIPSKLATLEPTLEGEHQRKNLRTVLAALSVLQHPPSERAIRNGLASTARLSGIRGRLEELPSPKEGVRLIIDVAHNEAAFERICDFFLTHIFSDSQSAIRPIVVMGMMKDKNVAKTLSIVAKFAKRLIAVAAPTSRSLETLELCRMAKEADLDPIDGRTVLEGFEIAMETASTGDIVLLTGSHYVVGEFLKNYPVSSAVSRV